MTISIKSATESDPDSFRKNYEKALAQTITDDEFNAKTIGDLTRTLAEDDDNSPIVDKQLKDLLLETLDDHTLGEKFLDFYPSTLDSFERESETKEEDWDNEIESDIFEKMIPISEKEAAERLDESGVPGRYEIIKLLGTGATGQVFAVKDNNLDRRIAVKFMHPKDVMNPRKNERFLDEAAVTAKLDHPNILPVHNLDYTDGAVPFFSMRLADGLPLEDIIPKKNYFKGNNIDILLKKINIIYKVCEAMAYAHDKKIAHNDIKPGNIMIGEYGDVLLLDWGTSTTEAQRNKENAKILGTPMYMSPEQARKEVSDEISDIYCIGSTFLHLVTGRFPLYSDDAETFWNLKCDGFYQKLNAEERQRIPPRLAAIIEHCIEPDREKRYQSINDLLADLNAFQKGEPVSVYQDPIADQLKRIYRKNKKTIMVIILCAIMVGVFGYMIYLEKLKELSEWKPIYNENFDNYSTNKLASEWKLIYIPGWNYNNLTELDLKDEKVFRIEDGKLQGISGNFTGAVNLRSTTRSAGNLKVSWEITPSNTAHDMNMFIGGNDRFNAYLFHIGGFGRIDQVRLTKYRSVQSLDIYTFEEALKPFTTYKFTAQKIGPKVQLFIDDKLIIDYTDPIPYVGPQHETFGFEMTQNHPHALDNIRVWDQPLPQKISPIIIGDDYFSHGHFQLSLNTYDDIRTTYTNSDMAPIALFRSAQCLIELEKPIDARIRLKQFMSQYPDHEYVIHALINLCGLYLNVDDWDSLHSALTKYSEQFKNRSELRWLHNAISDAIQKKHGISRDMREVDDVITPVKSAHKEMDLYNNLIGQITEKENMNFYRNLIGVLKARGHLDEILALYGESKTTVGILIRMGNLDKATAISPTGQSVIRAHIINGNWSYVKPLLYRPDINWNNIINSKEIAELVAPHADKPHYCHELLNKPEPKSPEEILAEEPHNFEALVQLGYFEKAKESYEKKLTSYTPSWKYAQLLSVMGKEDEVINSTNQDHSGVTKTKAYATKALRLWMKGDREMALEIFKQAQVYQGKELSDYIGFRIAPIILRWHVGMIDDKGLRKELEMLGDNYGETLKLTIKYMLGDLSESEFINAPAVKNNNLADAKIVTEPELQLRSLNALIARDYKKALALFIEQEYTYDMDRQLLRQYFIDELSKRVKND